MQIYDQEGYWACPACHGARRHIGVYLLADAQEWFCIDDDDGSVRHVVIMDRAGRSYIRTEHPKADDDWRAKVDWQRTDTVDGEEITPQKRAWYANLWKKEQAQRRKGGKGKRGGSGYNYYTGEEPTRKG